VPHSFFSIVESLDLCWWTRDTSEITEENVSISCPKEKENANFIPCKHCKRRCFSMSPSRGKTSARMVPRGPRPSQNRDRRQWRQRKRQKSNKFNNQNNNFAGASRFIVHFFAVTARVTTTWKCLISRFTDEVHMRQRNFPFLSELGYGSNEFNLRRVHLHLTKLETWSNRDEDWKNANSLFQRRFRCRRRPRTLRSLISSIGTEAFCFSLFNFH